MATAIRDYEPTNLEVYRRRKNIRQTDLARRMDRSQAEVSKIENGILPAKEEDLAAVIDLFPEFQDDPRKLTEVYIPKVCRETHNGV